MTALPSAALFLPCWMKKTRLKTAIHWKSAPPGLDRPLTKADHFKRYIGYVIKLETVTPVEKRKRFKGTIDAVSEDNVITLTMENIAYTIAFDNIAKAKIVLTDELWEKYLKSHKTTNA